jgi:hypothetical protein
LYSLVYSASVPAAGWYRVATTGSDGRGTYDVEVFCTGGSNNPSLAKVLAQGDWGLDKILSAQWDTSFPANQVRITRSASNTFLEFYFTGAVPDFNIRVNRTGFDQGVYGYSGSLPAGGDTVKDSLYLWNKTNLDTLYVKGSAYFAGGVSFAGATPVTTASIGNFALTPSNYGSGYFKTVNGNSLIGSGDISVSSSDSTKLPLAGGTLTGDLRIDSNWGSGTFNEQLIIYGTYPSMTFRSTTSDTGWLVHTQSDGGLTYYSIAGASTNNWTQQMTLLTNGELRKGGASGNLYIHSGNYNSYSPTLTGGGASGTWDISISGTAANSSAVSGRTAHQLFNNMGQSHSTYTDFNNVPDFGTYYVQQGGNSPTGVANHQWYGFSLGLGNDYAFSSYASQFYWPRRAQNSDTYIYVRDREGGSWTSWTKIKAGYADSAGSATDSTKLPLSGGTLTGTILVGTSGTGSASRALRVAPSGSSPASFGSYSGSWRSTIEIWDNAATRMLFLAPPDGTNFNYSYIKSTDAGLLIDVGSGGSTRALTIDASGVVTAPVDLRAPIFYDSDNTGYYLNPAGTSRLFNTQTFAGGVAEFYTSAGSLRGYINATDTDDNHFQFATSGGEDIVFRDGGLSGTRNLVIRGANAGTEAYGSMRSPIFYDSNNTGYYVDPTSTSRLSTIECGNVYNVDGGWFRNYGATGIYNQSYGNHFYSDAQNYWNVSNGGATAGGLRFRDQHDGTIRGYVYVNNSNDIGFLGSGGGWRARVVGNDYFLIDGSSIRAPLYYDSTNTSYYFRPASSDTGYLRGRLTFGDYGAGIVGSYSSYRYQLVFSMGAAYTGAIDGTSVSGGYGLWYSHPNAGGVASNLSSHGLMNIVNGSFQASLDASMRAVSDMRSPIYYDIDNTGYYVNAASTSYLYHLQLSGASYFRPSSWIQLDSVYGLYWPNNYGLHVRANDQSTYTQLCIQGSKNSYGGILDLYSSVNGIMYDSGGNGGVYREANGRWYFYHLVGNNCMGINTSTTSSSYGLYVSGGIYSTGNVVAYSDARRKANVVTVGGALDKVAQLRGVYYTRIPGEDDEKTDPNRREIGVIAQEVNEILPEVVTYAADIDEYGVQYGNFAGLFIEAIKELKSQVATLNAEVAELRGRTLQ